MTCPSLQSAIDSGWFLTTRCLGTGHTNMEALLATAGEVAQGLAALHAQGMVHGDLSAYNVVLSSRSLAANRGGRGFVAKVRGCLGVLVLGSQLGASELPIARSMPWSRGLG